VSVVVDLLVKGGDVLDPGSGLEGKLDVAVAGGVIVEVAPDLSAADASHVVDATGCFVTPGLVDLHTHIYRGVTYWGIDPDPIGAETGVTTWIDAGSAGAFTLAGLREFVVARSALRIYGYLNITAIGLVAHNYELALLEHCNPDLFRRAYEANRDFVVGVKARMGSSIVRGNGVEPLRIARRAAEENGLPMMVHIGDAPPDIREVLALMRPGDVLTHCCTGHSMRLVDDDGRLLDVALRAAEAGVVMDVGHGIGSFSFRSAEQLFDAGLRPDVISTDLHALAVYGEAFDYDSRDGPLVRVTDSRRLFDMPTCMSKFLYLGMSFRDIVAATTSRPAAALGRTSEIGSLRVGARADIALFTIERGSYTFYDVHGERREGSERVRNVLTIAGGVPLERGHEPPEPPVWVEVADAAVRA
jgi:dihydroorotase